MRWSLVGLVGAAFTAGLCVSSLIRAVDVAINAPLLALNMVLLVIAWRQVGTWMGLAREGVA